MDKNHVIYPPRHKNMCGKKLKRLRRESKEKKILNTFIGYMKMLENVIRIGVKMTQPR